MKVIRIFSVIMLAVVLTACTETEDQLTGEFLLGEIYADSMEPGGRYSIVLPIKWTGKNSATITSIEIIKENGTPVTFEEDGIAYEFYGADPLKKTGLYSDGHNIGEVKDINGFTVKGESRIVSELKLGEVEEDEIRKAKIQFQVNGEKYKEIIEWDTFKKLNTN
ncbi:hypothetical protein ACQCVP_04250 [Rossellomorea vietnamensis]|uniref:hypothetical protein n=1 Tax=Rossellomorea vietnamensis TaxID=218284 RepID=UPI003CF3C4E0